MIPYIFGAMFDISWFYNGLENFKTTVTCNMLFKTIGIVAIFMFVKDENDLVYLNYGYNNNVGKFIDVDLFATLCM